MDEVDPYQSQRRRTYEPHKVMVVYPNNGDEQVAHRIADGRGPQRPESRECWLIWCPQLQYHDGAKTASENAASRSAVVFSSRIARSLELTAGRGVIAASFSMNSIDSDTRWDVPSRHAVLSSMRTLPSARRRTRP